MRDKAKQNRINIRNHIVDLVDETPRISIINPISVLLGKHVRGRIRDTAYIHITNALHNVVSHPVKTPATRVVYDVLRARLR